MQALTCLSDDEWEYAAPAIGWGPDDEGMQCILESMGGPGALAHALASQDETAASKLYSATILCGAEEARLSSDKQASQNGEGAPANSESIAPLDLTSPDTLASELSDSELACLYGIADLAKVLEVLEAPAYASADERAQLANCLEDEILLRMLLTEFTENTGPLSTESSGCIRSGVQGFDIARTALGTLSDEEEYPEWEVTGFSLVIFGCLSESEWEAITKAHTEYTEAWEIPRCVSKQQGEPQELAQLFKETEDETNTLILSAAMLECGQVE